jgi:hypothetical protein
MRPFAIALRKDVPSPFVPQPRGFEEKKAETATRKAEHADERQNADEPVEAKEAVDQGYPVPEYLAKDIEDYVAGPASE